MVCGHPEFSTQILLNRSDTIITKSFFLRKLRQRSLLQVVTAEAIICTNPEFSHKLTGYTYWCSIIQTVFAKGTKPTAFLNIQTTDTHCCCHIDTPLVW